MFTQNLPHSEEIIIFECSQQKNAYYDPAYENDYRNEKTTTTTTTTTAASTSPIWYILGGLFIIGVVVVIVLAATGSFDAPTYSPTNSPTNAPTYSPTNAPTNSPSNSPTNAPTYSPSNSPSNSPTNSPTPPTYSPTQQPTLGPTYPTINPTLEPTPSPTTLADNDTTMISIVSIVGAVLILIILIFCGLYFYKKKSPENSDELLLQKDDENDENVQNMTKFERAKNCIKQFAKQEITKCVEIKQRIDNKLKVSKENKNAFAFGIQNYISSITYLFPEASSFAISYGIAVNILNFVNLGGCDNCTRNIVIIWTSITFLFLIIGLILHYEVHKKTQHIFVCGVLYLTFMLTQNAAPLSCIPHFSSNVIYTLNMILLGAIIGCIQINKLFDDKCHKFLKEIESTDLDQDEDKVQAKELADLLEELNDSNIRNPKYISYYLKIIAIKYPFQVSLIVVYNSLLCLFNILYNECLECDQNDTEPVLRLLLFGLFLLLEIYIEIKITCSTAPIYDQPQKSRCSMFGKSLRNIFVLIFLMNISSTKTISCLNFIIDQLIINIILGISVFVVVLLLLYEIWDSRKDS